MATTKQKRLPKELQIFKRELKELSFHEKVKAYFDCSPYIYDLDSVKMDIILQSFDKEEKKEYSRHYLPIYNAIDRYADRIRAIDGNRIIYANYLDTTFRNRDSVLYTADFLNLILPKVEGALKGTKEKKTRETLTEVFSTLKSYQRVNITAPDVKLNKEKTSYEVLIEEEERALYGVIDTLKGIISLLKCYLESLKEFLEWVGTPELRPKEFFIMERELSNRFQGIQPHKERSENPDASKFPLFFSDSQARKEYLSIDYTKLPLTVDIFKENNLFANAYRSFFSY